MKIDIYPEKAQYLSKEEIRLLIEFEEPVTQAYHAILYITHLLDKVYEGVYNLPLITNEITIEGIDTDFGGFGVELFVYQEEELLGKSYTAFDVVSNCNKAIRYGFLSDFSTESGRDCKDISNLRKFHINMIQYYDWSYRHDNLVSDQRIYKDMMGREVDLEIVMKKINTCRAFGMKSIGYGAIYAASKKFYEENREYALYTSVGEPLIFINIFYIMNIARNCKWRDHIIEEYAKAISKVGFDGIHMDTYGFPKTAYSYQKENLIKLEEEYPYLIEDTKKRLNEITQDNHLIFNNVGNWPVKTIAQSPQDAIYIEVWDPYVTYSHVKQIIRDARRECEDKKPVILAAYLNPFKTDQEDRAAYAAFLLTAVITVNGAYHLLLGEENAVLTQGYYVDHSIMKASTSDKMRTYYDFIVQYMELFYDTTLVDVSMTHIGWDNTEYLCFHDQWSVDGEAGKVWISVRENDNRKLISLVNLSGNDDNEWNHGKDKPLEQKDFRLQVQVDKEIKGIYYISPDFCQGKAQELTYEAVKTDRGWAIQFSVPKLEFWSSVWMDF
ncbi:MAG: glycoside hydrolase family 66 protein [Anaerocolumna sp.]